MALRPYVRRFMHLGQGITGGALRPVPLGGFTVRGRRFRNEDTLAHGECSTPEGPVVFAVVCDGHGSVWVCFVSRCPVSVSFELTVFCALCL